MTEKALKAEQRAASDTKTCFVIMPISNADGYPSGHFQEVYSQLIEPSARQAGYVCELANSTSSAHMIQLEVVTKVATADLCICDLSNNNPNVLFEYGIRQAFDMPTVLIKDDKTKRIFDLSGFRDIEYDHTLRIANTIKAQAEIAKAITDTVNGTGDSGQVFSLVKLLKLTKAALPTGELSQDDARFALLENKLDRLMSLVTPKESQGSFSSAIMSKAKSEPQKIARFDNYKVFFWPDAVVVENMINEELALRLTSTGELEQTKFWHSLRPSSKEIFKKLERDFSPMLIPF